MRIAFEGLGTFGPAYVDYKGFFDDGNCDTEKKFLFSQDGGGNNVPLAVSVPTNFPAYLDDDVPPDASFNAYMRHLIDNVPQYTNAIPVKVSVDVTNPLFGFNLDSVAGITSGTTSGASGAGLTGNTSGNAIFNSGVSGKIAFTPPTLTSTISTRSAIGIGSSKTASGASGSILQVIATGTTLEYVDDTFDIGAFVDNGVSEITTGPKGHRVLRNNCEIIQWTVTSNVTGSVEWGVDFAASGAWPVVTAITHEAGEYPILENKPWSTKSITGSEWSKRVFSEGDIIQFRVDGATGVSASSITLKARRIP